MPLFGTHKNKDRTHHNEQLPTNEPMAHGRGPNHGVMPGGAHNTQGTGIAGQNDPAYGSTIPATGPGMAGHQDFHEPGYGNNAGIGSGHHAAGNGTTGAYGPAGAGMNQGQGQGLPPAGTLNNQNQTRGGTGHGMTGKVEQAVGSLVGSSALKAKGLQKEQEAGSIKIQGQELAEAERLEREALMRRERAVGHGAHPDNKHPGAGVHPTGPGGMGYN